MSNAMAFDTLKFVKHLTAHGFSKEQAEVLAEEQVALIEERLASKQDLRELEMRLRHDLTVRLGGIIIGATAFLTVIKFFG